MADRHRPNVSMLECRKACMLLGVSPNELTKDTVVDAWKIRIVSDTCESVEQVILVNSAKDTLMRWLRENKQL
jgi:hypothetical protein